MIKGLMGDKGLVVSGGNTSVPYVNQNDLVPLQGMIRVWGTDMQVFSGTSWMNMNTSYATVSLDQDTHILLQWAKKKMYEEQQLDELCKKYPGLRKTRDNFETFRRLVCSEEDVSQSVQSSP